MVKRVGSRRGYCDAADVTHGSKADLEQVLAKAFHPKAVTGQKQNVWRECYQ
jgi:hypothetical protein